MKRLTRVWQLSRAIPKRMPSDSAHTMTDRGCAFVQAAVHREGVLLLATLSLSTSARIVFFNFFLASVDCLSIRHPGRSTRFRERLAGEPPLQRRASDVSARRVKPSVGE